MSANEISNQQGVTQVNADYTIQNGYHGENITIGIVDTGIDESHAELEGKVRDGGDWQYGVSGLIDHNGHGTHVAAIAAAKLNGSGMVGIAPKASLKSYKLFNEDGSSCGINFQNALSQVIDSAASSDVSILNNSWANPESMESIFTGGFSVSLQNELPLWRRAVNDGKVLVFAAGNESRTQPSLHSGLPAYDPDLAKGWLAAVAVDLNQKQTLYSNRCGLAADWCLAAPGGGNNPKADGIISARVGGGIIRVCQAPQWQHHTCLVDWL
ncbi:S8 family serine peptidase [Alphaproteobacteria bacterium]|nr:S8 family serine peptidase [Alphaproteobacteria bacterium]